MGDNDDEFQLGTDNGYEKREDFPLRQSSSNIRAKPDIFSNADMFSSINLLRSFLENLTTLSVKGSIE